MSGKPEQILDIKPPTELVFTGPFNVAVSSMMKLSNPSERKVCFKIKTTAPKRYCVKPNSGVIDPQQTVQISVSLQPFDYDPNEKNRHKFMVQSMFAPEGEINQETLWKETDTNQLMDSKLRCVFVMPEQDEVKDESVLQSSATQRQATSASNLSSPKNVLEDEINLKKTVEEIKKLQEEVSTLRQQNIQLKEESLRQKRLAAANRSSVGEGDSFSASSGASPNTNVASGLSSTMVTASNPNVTALNNAYLYAALLVLILGIALGKWIL